jgi:hypothetical protein
MSSIRITVGAQADASLARIFAPMVEASTRARARITRDATASAEAMARATEKAAQKETKEREKVAAKAEQLSARIAAEAQKAAAIEAATAQRSAQAKVKAEQKAFDERLRLAQRARAAEAREAAKGQAELRRLAAQAEREAAKMSQREQARKDRAAQAAVRAEQRMFDSRVRDSARRNRAEERDIMRTARQAERKDARTQAKGLASREQMIREIGAGAMRNLAGVARAGVGIGKDAFSATGVTFDTGTILQRNVELEKSATDTTLSAFSAKGQTAEAKDVQATIAAVRSAGNASAQDFNAMSRGLSSFVSKSADLETGKKVLADLGNIARATGSEVEALVSASGDVAKTLEDTPDKADRLLRIMRLVAKQGAMGNVEIKDLATYMGNITSSAFMYEGSTDTNIGVLGALAQVAMKGGATSAAEGTRAASSFGRDVTKGAALERFEKAGVNIFADKERTKLLSPEKIILQFLKKTGGSLDEMSDLFQNEMSKKVIKGFSQTYQAAGGGQAGLDAVAAEFKKFSMTMSPDDVSKASALSKTGAGARGQLFQNKLEEIGGKAGEKLYPALQKLEPLLLKLADGFTKIVTWAADNPGKAILAAIIGSIGKAAIGTAIAAKLSGLAGGMAGLGGGGGAGGALGGVLGAGGGKLAGALGGANMGMIGLGALAVGSVALAAYQGKELYDQYQEGDASKASSHFGKYGMQGVADSIAGNDSFAAFHVGAIDGIASRFAKFLPPPATGPQPAGGPPAVGAPPPNPVPTLQGMDATLKSIATGINTVATNTAGGMRPPGVDSAGRSGPAAK